MDKTHTSTVFAEELKELAEATQAMFTTVTDNFGVLSAALEKGDDFPTLDDDVVNAMEKQIDELTLRLLVLRVPKAGDLRFVISVQRIAVDLERIGDYSAGLARHFGKLQGSKILEDSKDVLREMMDVASEMLTLARQAFGDGSVRLAMQAWHLDDRMDDLYADALAKLHDPSGGMSCDSEGLGCTMLLAARGLERVGDHVTNIAEHIYFMQLGESFPGRK